MAKLLEFPSERGEVAIAIREPQDAVSPVGVADSARERMAQSLDSVLSMVASVGESFRASLESAPVESGEVEFGLQFTGKGTVYVMEAGAGAAFTVRLTVKPS